MKPPPLRFLSSGGDCEKAGVVILGFPLEKTLSFRGGTSQAPLAVRMASQSVESFSAVFGRDIAEVGLCDLGDLDCQGELGLSLSALEEELFNLLRKGKKAVIIGGEHTLTLGVLKGVKRALGEAQILAFDAHSDFREEYEGLRVCHATVLRRCSELAPRMAIVGARAFFGEELKEAPLRGLQDFAEALDPALPLHLSIDLDVLDPPECPGVANPEPGGLGYWDIIGGFQSLRGRFEVVALDICELSPPFDPSGISAVCAAKLIVEAVASLFC